VTHKTGDTWHIRVPNLRDASTLAYAWEARGEWGWKGRARFAPGSPLLDPYATFARPVKLPESEQGGRVVLAGAAAERVPPAVH
jgi:pullulanase/glycogen debranching enzyme